MSRIGRQPVIIPTGVEVLLSDVKIDIKGPKGSLSMAVPRGVKIDQKENQLVLTVADQLKENRVLWGTVRSRIANMVEGTTKGFQKKLEVHGVGYKVNVQGSKVVCELGFSTSKELQIPENLEVKVQKNVIEVSGFDKQLVGSFASDIRKLRPPEPYKGKGIRYLDEYVIRKEGKRSAGEEEK